MYVYVYVYIDIQKKAPQYLICMKLLNCVKFHFLIGTQFIQQALFHPQNIKQSIWKGQILIANLLVLGWY